MDTPAHRVTSAYQLDNVQKMKKIEEIKDSIDQIDGNPESKAIYNETNGNQEDNSICVLVVDEKPLTQTIRIMLQGLGFAIEIANNGAEALMKALKKVYDLVIIEEDLPDSNGAEIAHIIKKMDERTKTIVLTSVDYFTNKNAELYERLDELLIKPFTPNELIETVKKLIDYEQIKEINH
jgi:response regulator RpfG family c-di-GMP phosphodiesterase